MSRSDQSKRAIILSPLEWERWSSRKELAISLAAAGWRVVYSNGPIQTWQVASAARQGAGLMATVTRDCGVDVVRSGLFPFHRTTPSWFSQMANSVFAKNLTTLVNDGCCVAEAITVCFDPVFANLARCIPGRTVYFVVDELSKYPNWQVSGALREREMMNVADGVVGFTASMLERILSQYPRQHLVLPLAVNPDLFEGGSAGHQPDALGAVPHPRIGWVGGINHKIDFDLVKAVAQARPQWHWVFVGSEKVSPDGGFYGGDDSYRTWCEVKRLRNVHYLGEVQHDAVPDYLAHFDACAMPYMTDDSSWAKYGFPLKMFEYFAAGKPVISTRLFSVVEFQDALVIGDSAEAWSMALDDIAEGGFSGDLGLASQLARENTWRARGIELGSWLSDLR